MGLLTNPKTREKAVKLISRHNNKLCLLCYVAGIVWFLALAYRPLNAGTYFSENALLPGLVESDFYNDHGASEYYRRLKEELRRIRDSDKEENAKYHIPSQWLELEMRNLGLDTYIHNYTFVYPAGILKGQIFEGQNVYGILRAPRASSTEAVVLTAPFRPQESDLDRTNAGIALMYGLIRAFRKHTYWAKDIIFLVTEHEQIGMQAWLGAYHDSPSQYIDAGELHGRSGSIQAAINLEISQEVISRFNIKLEGLNGQLPNLDLINTVVRLCRREGIPPSLQKRSDYWNAESQEGFLHSLKTMLLMMWHQSSGVQTGNHGLFHRYHIEAITLQGVKMKSAHKTYRFVEMGRVIEGVYRSLNNLLERFHQSFFFYLLPATDRYVSIGLYMPPFGLLAAPILIKAIALWISYSFASEGKKDPASAETKTEEESKKERTDNGDGDKEDKVEDKEALKENDEVDKKEEEKEEDAEKKEEKVAARPSGLMSVSPTIIMSMFFGLVAYHGPRYSIETSTPFHLPPGDGLAWGVLALMFSGLLFPRILHRKAEKKGNYAGVNPYLLKCVALLTLGVVLGGLSVMNISLAFILTLTWTPIVLLIWPSTRRWVNWLQYLILVLVSPLGMLYIASMVNHLISTKFTTISALHSATWTGVQHALVVSVVDGHMVNNWTYSLVSLVIYPTWLMFWSLLWARPDLS